MNTTKPAASGIDLEKYRLRRFVNRLIAAIRVLTGPFLAAGKRWERAVRFGMLPS